MTIKQHGGVFGRNPTFNNVTVGGTLTVDQIVEKTGATGITLDGVTLKDGNVVLANGKGIDFSATAGTGTSELFDDYEEGTFTPTVTQITPIYSAQRGQYTKIGNAVFFHLEVAVSSFTGSSAFIALGGLPFAAQDTTGNTNFTNSLVYTTSVTVTGYNIVAQASENNTFLLPYNIVSGGARTNVGSTQLGASFSIAVTGYYQAA